MREGRRGRGEGCCQTRPQHCPPSLPHPCLPPPCPTCRRRLGGTVGATVVPRLSSSCGREAGEAGGGGQVCLAGRRLGLAAAPWCPSGQVTATCGTPRTLPRLPAQLTWSRCSGPAGRGGEAHGNAFVFGLGETRPGHDGEGWGAAPCPPLTAELSPSRPTDRQPTTIAYNVPPDDGGGGCSCSSGGSCSEGYFGGGSGGGGGGGRKKGNCNKVNVYDGNNSTLNI